jgi:hypothetical protein
MVKGDLPHPPDNHSAADTRCAKEGRAALQLFLESIPAQIDAIKNRRQEEAIELRRFMMKRERNYDEKR